MQLRYLNPRLLALLIFFSGAGLYYRSTQLSYFKDKHAKAELDNESAQADLNKAYKETYYEKRATLATNKKLFEDLGSGLVIVAVVLFVFLLWYRVKSFADFKTIRSPRKIFIFILSNLAWLSVIPGSIWYYEFRFQRGDYEWFSDTIFIPQMFVIPFVCIGLIVMNIFIWLSSRHSILPATVFVKFDLQNNKLLPVEIFWGIMLLLNGYFFYWFVADGDHFSIPVNMFFTYLLLVLRAGRLKFMNEVQAETTT